MNKVKTSVLQMDFQRFFKRFLFLSLAVVILGSVLADISFRTQISEGISYVQRNEQEENQLGTGAGRQTGGEETAPFERDDYYGLEHDFSEHIPMTRPSTGAKIMLCAFVLLCGLIFAVYWLMVAAWLYQAAAMSGMNGFLWLLAGLCGNLFGGILFILVRSTIRKKCPNCGQWQRAKAGYCAHCGTSLYEKCSVCGEACANGHQFCSSCGNRLHDAE